MTERVLLLTVAIALAWLTVALWERRPSPRGVVAAAPGLVLVTADGCTLCEPAFTALTRAGVEPTVVDAGDMLSGRRVRSVPTVIVTDREGREILRRSGRAVITDAERIAQLARR